MNLFVFKGSHQELLVPPGRSVCDLLSEELKKTGNDACVCVGEPQGNAKSPSPTMMVRKMAQLRLSVIPKPGLSPVSKYVCVSVHSGLELAKV